MPDAENPAADSTSFATAKGNPKKKTQNAA